MAICRFLFNWKTALIGMLALCPHMFFSVSLQWQQMRQNCILQCLQAATVNGSEPQLTAALIYQHACGEDTT